MLAVATRLALKGGSRVEKAHLIGIRWRRLLGVRGVEWPAACWRAASGSDALREDGRKVVARVASGCFELMGR